MNYVEANRNSEPLPQGNIESPYDDAYCARMLFYSFDQNGVEPAEAQKRARAWVAAVAKLCFAPPSGQALNVAFTYTGLAALGANAIELALFPDALREGMGPRMKQLGDPIAPAQLAAPWLEPDGRKAAAADSAGLPLHAVVIVLFRRGADDDDELLRVLAAMGRAVHDRHADSMQGLQQLAATLERMLDARCKLRLPAGATYLGSQDLHHPLIDLAGKQQPVEYFGFRDGISQPPVRGQDGKLDPHFVLSDDHPLLAGGTYLVIRKLEQNVPAFWRQLDRQAQALRLSSIDLAERVVGRKMNGEDLPPYSAASNGPPSGCPFHSHVRRVNPNVDAGANPRILRRGMSYARAGKCGLMFMALNTDIEAQFEFIQRNWVQRGNHVGLLSSNRDPIAGLAAPNEPAWPFPTPDSARNDALAEFTGTIALKWGEYLFLPGKSGLGWLAGMAAGVEAAPAASVEQSLDVAKDDAARQALIAKWLDDGERAGLFWRYVQAKGGLKVGDWAFVADLPTIQELLAASPTPGLSVERYGDRMRASTGAFYLGMDTETAEYKHLQPVGKVIPSSDQELAAIAAFAQIAAGNAVDLQLKLPRRGPGPLVIDLRRVLPAALSAALAQAFGLPGPGSGSLLMWSNAIARYHFRVAPNEADSAHAKQAAQDFRAYVAEAIVAARAAVKLGPAAVLGQQPTDLEKLAYAAQARLCAFVDALQAILTVQGQRPPDDDMARVVLGIATGSLTAVATLFVEGLKGYTKDNHDPNTRYVIWPKGAAQTQELSKLYSEIVRVGALSARRGGPDFVHRRYRGAADAKLASGDVVKPGDTVLLWLGGVAAKANDDYHLFGIDGHYCPGVPMGKAIMEGILRVLAAQPRLGRIEGDPLSFTLDP